MLVKDKFESLASFSLSLSLCVALFLSLLLSLLLSRSNFKMAFPSAAITKNPLDLMIQAAHSCKYNNNRKAFLLLLNFFFQIYFSAPVFFRGLMKETPAKRKKRLLYTTTALYPMARCSRGKKKLSWNWLKAKLHRDYVYRANKIIIYA